MATSTCMRRTTLGPVNGAFPENVLDRSLDDSRMSFGTSTKHRKSIGATATTKPQNAPSTTKKAPTQSRMSLAPGSNTGGPDPRRSSLFGRPTGALTTALLDPRPLTSKAWMTDNIDKLAKFLVDMDYPARITPKLLASPTGKDFQAIMSFLLRLIDPQFALSATAGKMEDDVQLVFKALKYPFQISKTSLTAVGSQQSWPALLGSIMWLIELLEYDRLVRESEAPYEASPRAGEPSFYFAFIKSAYESFLSEDDDRVDEIKDSVAAAFDVQHSAIKEEIAAKHAEKERLLAQLAELKGQASKLPGLRARKAELEKGLSSQRSALAAEEAHCSDMTLKMAERKREVQAREQELGFMRDHLSRVQQQVDSQELHLGDVDVITKKKAVLKEQAAKFTTESRATAEAAFKLERELKESVVNLKASLARYASECTRLQVQPMGAKFSGGVDFSLALDEAFLATIGPEGALVPESMLALLGSAGDGDDTVSRTSTVSIAGGAHMAAMTASAATSSALLGSDVKGTIKAGLREIRAKFVRMTGDLMHALNDAEEALSTSHEARKEASKRLAAITRRVAEKDAAVEAHASELDAGLSGSQRRLDEVESAVLTTRTELASAQAAAMELSPHSIRAIEIQAEAHEGALLARRRATYAVVQRLVTLCHAHKFETAAKMAELAARAAVRTQELEAAPAPTTPPLPSPSLSSSSASSASALSSSYGTAAIPLHTHLKRGAVGAVTASSSTSSMLLPHPSSISVPRGLQYASLPAPPRAAAAGGGAHAIPGPNSISSSGAVFGSLSAPPPATQPAASSSAAAGEGAVGGTISVPSIAGRGGGATPFGARSTNRNVVAAIATAKAAATASDAATPVARTLQLF